MKTNSTYCFVNYCLVALVLWVFAAACSTPSKTGKTNKEEYFIDRLVEGDTLYMFSRLYTGGWEPYKGYSRYEIYKKHIITKKDTAYFIEVSEDLYPKEYKATFDFKKLLKDPFYFENYGDTIVKKFEGKEIQYNTRDLWLYNKNDPNEVIRELEGRINSKYFSYAEAMKIYKSDKKDGQVADYIFYLNGESKLVETIDRGRFIYAGP